MDPPRFADHYRALSRGLRLTGLVSPWGTGPTRPLYDGLVLAIVVYMLCCYIYTINTIAIPFQELCGLGVSTSNFICGILLTAYQLRFRHRLKRITDNMDQLAERIVASDLVGSEYFKELYEKNAKLLSILTNNSIFFSFTLPFIYCLPVPINDWLEGHYRSRLPVKIVNPFDDKLIGVYEVTTLLIACSIAFSTSKKAAMDCLFVTLLKVQSASLRYLSVALYELAKELHYDSNILFRRKLIQWFKLHQDITRNTQELIEAFSPVVIIYYMTVIGIVVCGAFVQSMKENEHIIQSISIGGYIFITLVYYFLLSNTADELTTEAQKLAFSAYSTPWHDMPKTDAAMIQLVITISTRPIEVTGYRAPAFVLNRETYAAVCTLIILGFLCMVALVKVPSKKMFTITAISAFFTFCKMKELYG